MRLKIALLFFSVWMVAATNAPIVPKALEKIVVEIQHGEGAKAKRAKYVVKVAQDPENGPLHRLEYYENQTLKSAKSIRPELSTQLESLVLEQIWENNYKVNKVPSHCREHIVLALPPQNERNTVCKGDTRRLVLTQNVLKAFERQIR